MDSWNEIWSKLTDAGWQLARSEILRETGLSWLVDALHCDLKAYYVVEAETLETAMEKLDAAIHTGKGMSSDCLGMCTRRIPSECPLSLDGYCVARSDEGWEWVNHRPVSCRYRVPKLPLKPGSSPETNET